MPRLCSPPTIGGRTIWAVIYILNGEPQAAEVSLRRALELEPGDHAALVRLGDVQYQMKNLAAATEIYEEVLAARPTSAAALVRSGPGGRLEGDHAGAIEKFEAALELQPSANSIHHPLGMALSAAG